MAALHQVSLQSCLTASLWILLSDTHFINVIIRFKCTSHLELVGGVTFDWYSRMCLIPGFVPPNRWPLQREACDEGAHQHSSSSSAYCTLTMSPDSLLPLLFHPSERRWHVALALLHFIPMILCNAAFSIADCVSEERGFTKVAGILISLSTIALIDQHALWLRLRYRHCKKKNLKQQQRCFTPFLGAAVNLLQESDEIINWDEVMWGERAATTKEGNNNTN